MSVPEAPESCKDANKSGFAKFVPSLCNFRHILLGLFGCDLVSDVVINYELSIMGITYATYS